MPIISYLSGTTSNTMTANATYNAHSSRLTTMRLAVTKELFNKEMKAMLKIKKQR